MMKRSTLKLALVALFATMAVSIQNAYGQAVSINTDGAAPNSSSILDVSSTTKGMLIPRMSKDERNLIVTPAKGLLIYQTDVVAGFYYWDGLAWSWLYSGAVPSIPGNVEHWLRPDLALYIYPEHNTNIKVYDAGQTYGLYYDGGTNQYGLYGRTTNVLDPTSAVVGFSDVTGKQTYGYLGYNGTYTAPTAGFGSIYGAAVYGVVDDTERASGFFRTTGNASYAANIAYSDVWIPGFFYGDHINAAFGGRPSVYGSMNSFVDVTTNQIGLWGRSEYKAGTVANSGTTIGGYFQGIGATQDAYGIYAIASTSGAAIGVGVYAENSGNRNGTDYYSNNIGAIEGVGAWNATTYNFGVIGRMAGTGTRSGGVMGTYWTSDWGSLGYLNSVGTAYGVCYVGGNTTTAKSSIEYSSVGSGGTGNLFGSWTRGEIYGMAIKGERYALYVEGKQFTNEVITQMNTNGTAERFETYVPTSMSADVYMKGKGTLSGGKAEIFFDANYESIISETDPIIVTITPIGQSQGIYLESVKGKGFTVAENNEGKSNVEFTWIAIATRKDAKNLTTPIELKANDYDNKLAGFMFNESDTHNSAQPMWWDGTQLRFDEIPRIDKPKLINKAEALGLTNPEYKQNLNANEDSNTQNK